MGARFAENGFFYIFSTVVLAGALELVTIPLFGALSDRLGRRPVYLFGAAFVGLFAFPFFWLLDTHQPVLIGLAVVLGLNLGHGAMYGPQASFFSELFEARLRYSGASLGAQLASVFAGGLSPLIATALLAWSGGHPWPIAVYLMGMALVTWVAVYLASETLHQGSGLDAPDERRSAAAS